MCKNLHRTDTSFTRNPNSNTEQVEKVGRDVVEPFFLHEGYEYLRF